MKKTIILLYSLFFFIAININAFAVCKTDTSIVMNIGGEDISASEFKYYYKKNNSYKKENLEDYLDLFIKFKLKVAQAKSEGLDTVPSFVNELKSYRDDLAKPYLTDSSEIHFLLKQAYDREREYVESAHILIKVAPDASPTDTLVAYKKIMDIYRELLNKTDDFEEFAKKYSEDGSNKDGGNIGYIVGGKLIYSYENAMFNLPVGAVSKPFRSRFGYHIVKVLDKRPAEKMYKSGHIFKSARNEDEFLNKGKEINEIYSQLENGVSFSSLAKKYSDDKSTASKGGEYDFLRCGTFPYIYEKNVLDLKKGQYSKPFKSKYGWHIVKALGFKDFPSFEEEKTNLQKIISNGERKNLPKHSLINRLKKEYFFTQNINLLKTLSSSYSNESDSSSFMNNENKALLFSFKDNKFYVSDFVKYLKNQKSNDFYKNYNEYVNSAIMNYENSILEAKYPDFGNLMNEYRDGILLFNVSDKDVWKKVPTDTLGLIKFFKKNKKNYRWEIPHYKGYLIYSKDKDIIKSVKKVIKDTSKDSLNTVIDRTFNDSIKRVKVEYGLYKEGENFIVDSLVYSKNIEYKDKKEWPFISAYGKNLKLKPRDYEDVRGTLFSDYQKYNEELWVEKLRNKFKVVIFDNVLKSIDIGEE